MGETNPLGKPQGFPQRVSLYDHQTKSMSGVKERNCCPLTRTYPV